MAVAKKKLKEPEELEESEPSVVAPPPAPPFTRDDQERMVATDRRQREFLVWVDGVRYEHVTETDDGRWVYAKS